MTTHFQLPIQFDKQKLKDDYSALLTEKWIPHFNESGYEGNWKIIPLLAPAGDENNGLAFQNNTDKLAPTSFLKQSAYFTEVLDHFKCELSSARILKLEIGAIIKPHKDFDLGYENDCFRIHIPIITNPNVNFILDGSRIVMKEGECWYTNVNFEHSVSNLGQEDRIHLVIDGQRNAWSDQLFFSIVPEEELLKPIEIEQSAEEIKLIINQLKTRTEPAILQLIEEYQQKLDNLT